METIGLTPSYCKLCGKEHYPKGDYAFKEFCSYSCIRKVEKIKDTKKILHAIKTVKKLINKENAYNRNDSIKSLCSFIYIKLQNKVKDIDILYIGDFKQRIDILKALKKCEQYCKKLLT